MTAELEARVEVRAGIGPLAGALSERPCTIAYMGASVTAQKEGFRPRLHELLCRESSRPHRSVAAGTGAMGSISGLFLMDELVLRHGPDLCLVEYATSDAIGTTPIEHLEPVLDGVVAKLFAHNCACCFLYLTRADGALAAESPVLAAYERVAERHGVPSIDLTSMPSGIGGEALIRDGVHTTALGSMLVAEAVARALREIRAAGGHAAPGSTAGNDRFAQARLDPPSETTVGGKARTGQFRLTWPYVEIYSGAELRFSPRGDLVGLLVVLGPASGYIRIESPASRGVYLLWDEYCSYERLGSVIFTTFARAGEPVVVRQLDLPVDYASARTPVDPAAVPDLRLKLLGLMVCP